MKDTFRISIRKINVDFEVPLIWITYFPFLGWLYPFIARYCDHYAMHHAKQAFVMALFFIAVPVILTFSSVFIPISLRAIKLSFVILIYISHLSYFILCARGIMKMREKKTYNFPFFGAYARRIPV